MVEQRADRLSRVFRALGDPTRRHMLRSLARHDCTVSELARPHRMSLAAASKHVRALERAGLLHRTVRGRTHTCRIRPRALAGAHDWLGFYARFWNERLDALEAILAPADHD